mmetsp:Transcript_4938/g.14857  ORF Transcript_4938/g.14857 Transcript_4938/m.14857 type:complete len:365 (-) Transcript_4938:498-1592(-)
MKTAFCTLVSAVRLTHSRCRTALNSRLCQRRSFSRRVRVATSEFGSSVEEEFTVPDKFSVEQGAVYVVATPIGNLSDVTIRALRCLRAVDIIAAEDTRHSGQLIKSLLGEKHSTQRFLSHHEHNWQTRVPEILQLLRHGKSVAVITDAGTPCISDPGFQLVRECQRAGIKVIPVPGPSAVVAALSVSGQPSSKFTAIGFVPQKGHKDRKSTLAMIDRTKHTVVFYESPHRLLRTLEALAEMKSARVRSVTFAKELTKMYENLLSFENIPQALDYFQEHSPRGEYTVVLGPHMEDVEADMLSASAEDVIQKMVEEGVSAKAIAKVVTRFTSLSKNDVYDTAIRKHKALMSDQNRSRRGIKMDRED